MYIYLDSFIGGAVLGFLAALVIETVLLVVVALKFGKKEGGGGKDGEGMAERGAEDERLPD